MVYIEKQKFISLSANLCTLKIEIEIKRNKHVWWKINFIEPVESAENPRTIS